LLTEPQTVTIGANARTLVKTESDKTRSVFTDRANGVRLEVSQSAGNRYRSLSKLTLTKVVTNPISGLLSEDSVTAHLVIDRPRVGFTEAEVKDVVVAALGWHTASTNANTTKVVAGEF
jgi:hypothetical protein